MSKKSLGHSASEDKPTSELGPDSKQKSSGQGSSAKPSKKKRFKIFIVIGALAIILAVLGLILGAIAKKPGDDINICMGTGCASSGGDESDEPAPVEEIIGKTIEDKESGYTIAIERVIFNVPFDDGHSHRYYKSLAVEVSVENNDMDADSFTASKLELRVGGQKSVSDDWYFQKYIYSNNSEPLSVLINPGNSSAGWLFFRYDINQGGNVELVYVRDTTSSDDEASAKGFTVRLK